MALKDMFQAMRKEGYVTAPLDRYLYEQANKSQSKVFHVYHEQQSPASLLLSTFCDSYYNLVTHHSSY